MRAERGAEGRRGGELGLAGWSADGDGGRRAGGRAREMERMGGLDEGTVLVTMGCEHVVTQGRR